MGRRKFQSGFQRTFAHSPPFAIEETTEGALMYSDIVLDFPVGKHRPVEEQFSPFSRSEWCPLGGMLFWFIRRAPRWDIMEGVSDCPLNSFKMLEIIFYHILRFPM